jgi:FAD/FMN-containing dehydrogenase/Fe-S oxidoreductase
MSRTDPEQAIGTAGCEVRFDRLTRELYATDASLHRIEPHGVAFPRGANEAAAVIRAAADAGMSVIPRGAGSGLVGGAIGEGLVVDFARHNRQISGLDIEQRTVEVGAGVVLDELNRFLKPHGLAFGPDVATSSRATLGGMIANNSSGARAPLYGTTADHVSALSVVLADGRLETLDDRPGALEPVGRALAGLVEPHRARIAERMPLGAVPPGRRPPAKRSPGYALDRFSARRASLIELVAGSEGTLAGILAARLRLVPLPREKGLGILFFASVAEAMQATVELLDLEPAAVEHVDRILFDQTRGQLQFAAARGRLELDTRPCEALLIVEFYDDVAGRLAALEARRLGLRTALITDSAGMNQVWALRKAGLSLLTGCPGPAKPVTGIEDTAVRPERLPEYVAGLQSILDPLGVSACFYGHAAAGLLHVRPVLDLHKAEDVRKLRRIAGEVSALVRQFKGSFAAEHGVGIARTEFMREQVGDELLAVMREVKRRFDPNHVFNPGKILDDGRYRIDTHLRIGPDRELRLPFAPVLAFARKDRSFIGNLEQCNGCGGCLKLAPTMCPTYIAIGEELLSTRGRANAIRAVLEGRTGAAAEPLCAPELEAALEACLSCKACAAECPSNVNLPLLKADLVHARQRQHGVPLLARLVSQVDRLGRLGTLAPALANAALGWPWLRRCLAAVVGLDARRPLPRYAAQRFDTWFARRPPPNRAPRGSVILWDDCFVRYHEPHIGRAAVAVLEAAGFAVRLLTGRRCCGRPAFSQGRLDQAARLGRHNLALLAAGADPTPILFLEPSCWSMFAEDYRELNLDRAGPVAERAVLFEQFIASQLDRDPAALPFRAGIGRVAIHAHCHAKALLDPSFLTRLLQRVPGSTATLLETGCCGMAGAFGATRSKYDLSIAVAAPLVDAIRQQPAGTTLVASGTSCRQQIEHLTPIQPRHAAEVLAQALACTSHRI